MVDSRRIFRVQINSATHGFFAQVVYVLNQLLYCEREGFVPVVHIVPRFPDGPNPFYDAERGENSWEYYFDPVSDVDWRDIPPDAPSFDGHQLARLNAGTRESIFLYPYHLHRDKVGFDADWYAEQRAKAAGVIERHVRVKPEILDEVDAFHTAHLAGRHNLGLHLRGTDKRQVGNHRLMSRVMEPRHYRVLIDRHLDAHPGAGLFVATDQREFLDELCSWYGSRVVHTDSLRGSGRGLGTNPFEQPGAGYRKGAQVLIDALLLSRCDSLLKCASAVGAFATFFAPDLPFIDVNHHHASRARILLYDVLGGLSRPLRRLLGWLD